MNTKLLLHHCCAPCSPKVVERLSGEYSVYSFWYNPNIYPGDEHEKRKASLANYVNSIGVTLLTGVEDSYDYWLDQVSPPDADRCDRCYRLRLRETAEAARRMGIRHFSTTLLSSPHQKHDCIRIAGDEIAREREMEFVYRDFRPSYYDGKTIAYRAGSYMQKYCGCAFSLEDRKPRKETSRKK